VTCLLLNKETSELKTKLDLVREDVTDTHYDTCAHYEATLGAEHICKATIKDMPLEKTVKHKTNIAEE
jgi:heterodisulfide reductase subunit B